MNDTWIIGEPEDHGHGAYVLRRHRFTELAPVEREHQVMTVARTGGVPAPAVLPDDHGRPIVAEDDRLWTLYAHAAGHQVARGTHTVDHSWAMGAELGRVHRALAESSLADEVSVGSRRNISQDQLLARLRMLTSLVDAVDQPLESDGWAYEILAGRTAWIERNGLPDYRPTPDEETQPLHGDYQDTNVFFSTGSVPAVSAIIDWDKAEQAPRAFEVIRAVHLSFGLESELTAAFVSGYRDQHTLTAAELDRAVWNYHVRNVRGDVWVASMLYEHGDERVRQFLAPGGFVPFIDQWPDVR